MPVEVVVHVNTIVSPSVGLLTSAVNVGVAGLSEDQAKVHHFQTRITRQEAMFIHG